jgi:predicted Fe-Mo cluster-binding NifX family protein
MTGDEGGSHVTVAVCSRRTDKGYVVTSFEESTLAVIATIPEKRVWRVISLVSTGPRPNLDKAAKLRDESPTVAITSAIGPYSLVSLSAKGVEVRLVDDGTTVENALQLYTDNKTRLACNVINVIQPRENEAC